MRNVHINVVCLLLATGLFGGGQAKCAASDPSAKNADPVRKDLVVIALRPNVQTDAKVIRLADIANITGGNAALRDQVKQLDIEDALTADEVMTILPPQVEFRLRIAGINVEQVSIRGNGVRLTSRSTSGTRATELVTPAATSAPRDANSRRVVDFSSLSLEEGPLEHEIVQAAKSCVLSKLPWSADKIDIRLSQPLPAEVRQLNSAVGYECSAEMRMSGPAVGRVQVRVIADAPGKPTFDVPVVLDVRHFENIVLTTKAFERGHAFTANDLYLDRQDVTELSDYCSNSKELIGSSARRSMRALMPVRMNDVETVNRSESSILIKRREQVKMIARAGALNISATGEALQDGRLGETIRLRNIESNANVQGRVSGTGEVEISF